MIIKTLNPIFLSFVLGAFTVLAFAPFYWFPVSILSVAGLVALWIKTANLKQAFKLGFVFGLGLYIAGIYWIYISLHTFGGMPWWFAAFCTFCLCAFMALFVGLVGYLSKKLGWICLSVPVLWALSDWVRSWIFTGFPWLTMGYSQVPHSPLAGFAPVVGVYGVSVITVSIAALIGTWLAAPNQTVLFKRNSIFVIFFLIVIGMLLKAVEWTTPHGKPITAALLQGNIAQDVKWSPDQTQATIDTYLNMVQQADAALIVLPETAFPVIYDPADPQQSQYLTVLKSQKSNNLRRNIIAGFVGQQPETNQYLNSAVSFGESPSQTFSKNHLVPFGEYIPLKQVFGWIYRDYLNMPLSDLARGGATQSPMRLGNQQIGVNICYEDVFGEEIIRQLPAATLLVNISNDAWYGKSIAADQHMQFSQTRALETGRMMLRATNTGATASIDQHGYVLAHAPHDVQTTLNVQAQGYTGSTPYVRWGNWPFIVFCFTAIAFVIMRKNKVKSRF
jgi:apolipoprotein N-acyltransferase